MEEQTAKQLNDLLTKLYDLIESEKKLRKRINTIAFSIWGVSMTVGIALLVASLVMVTKERNEADAWASSPESWDWSDMWDDVKQGDYEPAVEKANFLISKNPEDPFNNSNVGDMYISFCKYEEARQYYQKAYDLWPSEAHQCDLDTVNKKLGL